jgi:alanyl aminopeptidase
MTMRRSVYLLFALLVSGCATVSSGAASAPATVDGHARLSAAARPTAYRLDLTVDPRTDRFSGEVEIDLIILEPTTRVTLHGQNLNVQRAQARSGELRIELKASAGEHGGLLLSSEVPFSGELTLEIDYEAPLEERLNGLYRTQDSGRWFAFTQFEAMDARRAFPCFDEPVFKTPFTTTLRVPEGMNAFANTPETKRETLEGWTTVTFAQSKPLPTYLVAFAIGDIVARDGATTETDGVPFRVLAVRGREGLADWALEHTPAILGVISDYFGQPLPYAKLDLIGVPNFGAGAMENVGLVTFREQLVLLDPKVAPPRQMEGAVSVIGHELAHMWFGNLVTMPWWDDLWLNEAFATWLEAKVTDRIAPEMETRAADVLGALWVMGLDVKANARSIREPIAHGGDVRNAFDGITYTKGAAVLGMTESWIGDAALRQGLRTYMKTHAHGGGTTQDLWVALDSATDKPVSQMLSSFTDQPGVPRVDVTTRCEGSPTLIVRQERHARWESGLDREKLWKIPFCFRYPVAGQVVSTCTLLETREQEIPLEGETCPLWLHPNADERGYYRWSLPEDTIKRLVVMNRSALTLREKIAFLPHLWALTTSKKVGVKTYLEAIEAISQEHHPLLVGRVAAALDGLTTHARSLGLQDQLAKVIRRRIGSHLTRFGSSPTPGETPRTTAVRSRLKSLLADAGQDPELRRAARASVDAFLTEPTVVPDGLASSLMISAWDGDEALFERYLACAQGPVSPGIRAQLVRGLGAFLEPPLIHRALDAVIDGPLRTQDLRSVYRAASSRPKTRRAAWSWFQLRYDDILAKLGKEWAIGAPRAVSGVCDSTLRAEIVAFFADPARMPKGADRNLGLQLERIDECLQNKALMQEPVEAYLRDR